MTCRILLALVVILVGACDTADANNDRFGPRADCQRECDNSNFGMDTTCISATELSNCRDECLNTTENSASGFAACMEGIFPPECAPVRDCFTTLGAITDGTNNGSNNGAMDPIADCKAHCEKNDHCLADGTEATTLSDCKDACEAQDADELDSFGACVEGEFSCRDQAGCYEILGVSYAATCTGDAACRADEDCLDSECVPL